MGEFYLQSGLISQHAWRAAIEGLRTQVQHETPLPLPAMKASWLQAFETAVLERAREHDRVGVLFSGGVDSTFIAFTLAKHHVPFTCYTVGFQEERTKDPEDVTEAKRVAAHYGWTHTYRVLTVDELEPYVQDTVQALGDAANPVSVGVGSVIVAGAKLAAADGTRVLFGGLGSEEIFAGYHRHGKVAKIDDECWAGLSRMYERDLLRDSRIGEYCNIVVPTPFLAPEVIRLAMLMPDDQKIRDGHKKYILRVIAEEAGLKHEFAFRPKRAAQYGSRFDKALEKLAKLQGMKKTEYLEQLQRMPKSL